MSAFCLVVTQIALMGGLLHLVQRRRDWVRPQPAQASPRCTKCNSPLIKVQCIHQSLYDNLKHTSDIGFLLCSYPGGEKFRTRSYFKVRGQGQRHFSEGSMSLGKDVSYCVAGSERVRLRLLHVCRATLCIVWPMYSVAYAVVRCPSVCPSVAFVYCIETSKHFVKVF